MTDVTLPTVEGEVKTTQKERTIVRTVTIHELGPIARVAVDKKGGWWIDRDAAQRVARAKDPLAALERTRHNYNALTEAGKRLFVDLAFEEYTAHTREPLYENPEPETAAGRIFVRHDMEDNSIWLPGAERPLSRVYATRVDDLACGSEEYEIDWVKLGGILTDHPWTIEWGEAERRYPTDTSGRWRWVFKVPQEIHDLWWEWDRPRIAKRGHTRLAEVLLCPALSGDEYYLDEGEAGTIEGIGFDPLGVAAARRQIVA